MTAIEPTDAGWRGAQNGMVAALANADREFADWGTLAIQCFTSYTEQFGDMPFMTEDVRDWAEQGGLPPPPDRRAWGAVAAAARRAGLVRSLGYAPQKSANAHRAPKTLWVRA